MTIMRNCLLCLLFALNCFAQVNKVEEKKINFDWDIQKLAGNAIYKTIK